MTTRAAAEREGQVALDEAKELADEIIENPEVSDYLEGLQTASGKSGKEVAEEILEGDADSAEVGEILTELGADAAAAIEAGAEATLESGVVPPIP
ncbi:MAG TPA: hypothetical protein VIX91_21745 [Candidatus Acidoferrum sp.]